MCAKRGQVSQHQVCECMFYIYFNVITSYLVISFTVCLFTVKTWQYVGLYVLHKLFLQCFYVCKALKETCNVMRKYWIWKQVILGCDYNICLLHLSNLEALFYKKGKKKNQSEFKKKKKSSRFTRHHRLWIKQLTFSPAHICWQKLPHSEYWLKTMPACHGLKVFSLFSNCKALSINIH